jgi:hypothetical protein
MKMWRLMISWTTTLVILLSLGCAGAPRKDIEGQLIDAFREERKSVEIKDVEAGLVYTIDPLFRKSERGCPLALIRGWKGDIMREEKEVEVCD